MERIPSIKFIFILGAPASGKGTICKILSDELNYFHLSIGDYLRSLVQAEVDLPEKSPFVKFIIPYLDSHDLIPAKEIIPMLHSKIIQERVDGKVNFLIDGFPRDLDAAVQFERKMKHPDLVLVFECPRQVALERFLDRKRNGARDTEEVFDKRYAEYERNREVLFKRYDEQGIVVTIDSSGPTEKTRELVLQIMKDD